MSDREAHDLTTRREVWKYDADETASYSDKCKGCGHTRAAHLPRGANNIHSADSCTVQVCKRQHVLLPGDARIEWDPEVEGPRVGDPTGHANPSVCEPADCDCDDWRKVN